MAVGKISEKETFMKSNAFQLSDGIKNIHRWKLYQEHTQWSQGFLQLLLKKFVACFFSDKVKRSVA